MRVWLSAAVSLGFVAACQQAVESRTAGAAGEDAEAPAWTFDAAEASLKAQSCPPGTAKTPGQTIKIDATAVSPGKDADVKRALPEGVQFVAGWKLVSDAPGFGGLSGLAATSDRQLLSVSDAGAFVAIELGESGPSGSGALAYMLDAQGMQLSSKEAGDAEGLAVRGGMALVSFEQEFRVLAYDFDGCGASARGAEIARLPHRLDGKRARRNNGPEALELDQAGRLMFGYEREGTSGAVRGQVQANGTVVLVDGVQQPRGFSQVGLANGGAWTLYRSYDPARGNRNIVDLGDGRQIVLAPPLRVDNFEGIAAGPVAEGVKRLWLISDDNFSDRQETLLYVFDVTAVSQ